MSSVLQHPALILILAGAALPFLRGGARGAVMLAAPLAALALVWALPEGVSLATPSAARTAAPQACQMSSEDCSTKSVRGFHIWIGRTPMPTRLPCASNTPARALPVPTSIPM